MEAPAVQYVATPDGCNIAYTLSGRGPPLVFMPYLWSHVRLFWQPGGVFRRFSEELALRFRVLKYDSRGQGMSSRGIPDTHCLDDYVTDLETVVERPGFSRFILYGSAAFGHVAMRYAAKHPERLEALVLQNCRPKGFSGPGVHITDLARTDWETFLDVSSRTASPEPPDLSKVLYREASNQGDFLKRVQVLREADSEEDARQIVAPTLLTASRSSVWSFSTEDDNQRLAALIPNSQLVLFDHPSGLVGTQTSLPPTIAAIESFLAGLRDASKAGGAAPSGTLSKREIEVLRLVTAGMSNQEVAAELTISPNTVSKHVVNILAKTGARNRVEAASYAHKNGLV